MAQPTINEIVKCLKASGFTVTKLSSAHWQVSITDSRVSGRTAVRHFTNPELIGFYNMFVEEYKGWMLHVPPPTIDNAVLFLQEMGMNVTQQDANHWHIHYLDPSIPGKELDRIHTSAEVIEVYSTMQNTYKSYQSRQVR